MCDTCAWTPEASDNGLRKIIKSLKREQEVNETEMKLRRTMMELYEKRIDLITAINTRKLQCLTNQLDGVPTPERDLEVEKNERNMFIDISNELCELNYSLIDCLSELGHMVLSELKEYRS